MMTIESLSSLRPMSVVPSKDSAAHPSSPAEATAESRAVASVPAKSGSTQPDTRELDTALGKINQSMAEKGQDLVFSIDPDSERTIVKIVDQTTKEVLRQIPSQEALEIAKALDSAQGLLIRHSA